MIKNALHYLLGYCLSWGLLAWIALSGCGLLGGSVSPKVERFNCQVRALEPLVGDVLDAEDLLRDVYAGRASLDAVAAYLKLTQAQLVQFNAAIAACEPPLPVELPEGEQS